MSPRRGGYIRASASDWEPEHYAATWTPERPASYAWASVDVAWQEDRGEVMSVRKLAEFLGWTRRAADALLFNCARDRARWAKLPEPVRVPKVCQKRDRGSDPSVPEVCQPDTDERHESDDKRDSLVPDPGQKCATSETLTRVIPYQPQPQLQPQLQDPEFSPDARETDPAPKSETTPNETQETSDDSNLPGSNAGYRLVTAELPDTGCDHGATQGEHESDGSGPDISSGGGRSHPVGGDPDPGLLPCAPRRVVHRPSPRPRFDLEPTPTPQPAPREAKPLPQPQAPVAPPAPLAVVDDLGVVRVGDRALPGDLVALLYGMRGGEALALRIVRSPGAATTRDLLSIHPDRLRFVPGLGDARALALAAYLRDAWQVEVGCLCAEYHDERAWDACLLGDPPRAGEPPPAIFAPRHMDAFSRLGGRARVRQSNSFDLTQLRKQFMNLCKGAQ